MSQKDKDFLGLARKRFENAAEDEKELRLKFTSDLKFASPDGDDQWDPQLKMQREQAGRPAMAFPRCHTFVQQVSNEARQNKPQIKFAPRLDSDDDTSEVYEGLARFIQYTSDAQVAYETAIEYSAGASFGYYRLLTGYNNEEDDDLDIQVVPCLDPLTIYGILVPTCFNRKPRFGFVIEDMPKEEFKDQYPDSELSSLAWAEAEARFDGWVGSDSVRIAEYWYCVEKKEKGKRPRWQVRSCKTNGYEILPGDDGESSDTEWPGSSIPIVPVLGKQLIMEGKPKLFSVVRPQKSAQQLINYSKSRIAETLAQSPVSPFMMVEGQDAGYEKEWATINTNPRPTVHYRAVDVMGKPAPPPERNTFEPPIQALSAFVAQEIDDMKATTGIYDASLGNKANETSGRAIQARQESSNLTTMHFLDNLERSFKQAGMMIEELIPKVYDTEREISILGADEAQKVVKINAAYVDDSGQAKHYKIAGNRVPLVVTMGRAYDTKRMESFDLMQQLVQSAPNLLPTFGDVLFKNSDLAGADIIAERFQKMLPPQLQDNSNPLPPQAQAAVAQAQQQTQQLQAELQKLTFEKQAKVTESQGKLQQINLQHAADMELENRKMEVQIAVAEIQTKAQIEQQRAEFIADLQKQWHIQAHATASQADEHAHESALTAQKAHHDKEMAKVQAIHGAMQADQQAQHASDQSAQDAAQGSMQSAQEAVQPEE